jgi:hypothetical protein
VHPEDPQILIRVSRWSFALLEEDTFFHQYAIEEARDHEIGRGNVRGTPADMRAWSAAGTAFTEAILSAGDAFGRVVAPRYRWLRRLPGHAGRVERATRTYRQATAAAQAIYQPVFDEIERRAAAAEAERQQREEALQRFHEEALASAHERRARQRAVAGRAIWAWSPVDPTTVRVAESTGRGLTAARLDSALRALHGSGVRTVEWDPAARDAIARACAPPGTPPSDDDFRDWWISVTDYRWNDPAEIPAPDSPDVSGGGSHKTVHHSDYSGGGDVGGSSHGTSF